MSKYVISLVTVLTVGVASFSTPTVSAAPVPPTVTGPAQVDAAFDAPFTWDAVPGATSYYYWLINLDDGTKFDGGPLSLSDIGDPQDPSYKTANNFEHGARYRLWVRVNTAEGTSSWAPHWDFSIEPFLPPVITGPEQDNTSTAARLTWEPVHGATAYYYWIANLDDGTKFAGGRVEVS